MRQDSRQRFYLMCFMNGIEKLFGEFEKLFGISLWLNWFLITYIILSYYIYNFLLCIIGLNWLIFDDFKFTIFIVLYPYYTRALFVFLMCKSIELPNSDFSQMKIIMKTSSPNDFKSIPFIKHIQ